MLISQINQKNVCHYWYFLHKNFSYGPYLCDGYYNIMHTSNDSKKVAIVHVKKSGFNSYIYDFSVDYNAIGVNGIKDIHKYLMNKNGIV